MKNAPDLSEASINCIVKIFLIIYLSISIVLSVFVNLNTF
jgi:hypothetical protein